MKFRGDSFIAIFSTVKCRKTIVTYLNLSWFKLNKKGTKLRSFQHEGMQSSIHRSVIEVYLEQSVEAYFFVEIRTFLKKKTKENS